MEIQTFHKYNRLARRGVTAPLACSTCEQEYSLRADAEGEPLLYCYTCASTIRPGLSIYDRIKAVVEEYYV